MNEQQIRELFSNEEFVQEILALETPEEVVAALQEKDVDVTEEEVIKISDILANNNVEELTEEDLEQVAGGSIIIFILMAIGLASIITAGGTLVELCTRVKGRRW